MSARIFEGPPGETRPIAEDRVLDIIVTYLVQNLVNRDSSPFPLLVLPGHVMETRFLYDTLLQKLDDSRHEHRTAKMLLLTTLRALAQAPEGEQKALAERNEELLHKLLYAIDDGREKLRRFNALMADGKLRTAAKLSHDRQWAAVMRTRPAIHAILEAGAETEARDDDGEGSAEWWRRRLTSMPERFVQRDKAALSTLDRLNRLLKDDGIRIVLFTENYAIERQGRRYRPFRHLDEDLGRYTFSELYIRHPKALLFESAILHPGQEEEAVSDPGWLDAFLSKVIGSDGARGLIAFRTHLQGVRGLDGYREVAKAALNDWSEAHSQLYANWLEHIHNITLAHSATSSVGRRMMEQILGQPREPLPDLSALEEELDTLTEISWDSFYITAAKSGYEMIGISPEKVRGQKRNVPILFLRDMDPGEEALDLIYEHDGVIINEQAIRQLLGQLDGLTTRRARYLSSLCYALLFAYADRWSVASSLAKRAVEIAEPAQSEVAPRFIDNVTGREAYYLACVTRRLTSRERGDLAICQHYLELAREALAKDVRAEREGEKIYPPITGLRFDAEDVAVATARALFDGFAQKWRLAGNTHLVGQVRENLHRIAEILNPDDVCGDERIRRHSYLSLRTNYFSNLFLLECAGVLGAPDLVDISRVVAGQLSDWRAGVGLDERVDVSAMDMQTLLYGGSLMALPDVPSSLATIEFFQAYPATVGGRFLMPYDQSRYERMAALAASHRSQFPEQS
ncbi:hypothetical protein OF829_12580 [Sphingomonas sp. LB-2]|uniref:hypothetical protein n=1 Tax=Sphingomonas caeni TaxID=2984949 RepID=UPI0022317375|nr:hypothetical protein [Sphingomonas caeni]MCW3848078.1 hypothetical protein [Sphingomonas caeni]